jgi:hypothetical protein
MQIKALVEVGFGWIFCDMFRGSTKQFKTIKPSVTICSRLGHFQRRFTGLFSNRLLFEQICYIVFYHN